ncbi:unnamed protein product, partial [Vitis vinifera]
MCTHQDLRFRRKCVSLVDHECLNRGRRLALLLRMCIRLQAINSHQTIQELIIDCMVFYQQGCGSFFLNLLASFMWAIHFFFFFGWGDGVETLGFTKSIICITQTKKKIGC